MPTTPTTTPIPVAPIAISKIDVQKLSEAVQMVAPFIPKSWYHSLIIAAQIASIASVLLGAFTPIMPVNMAMGISTALSIVTIVLRVVRPNPPIAGGPQDLTN